MGCDITSGILKGCNDAKAGVETIYLGKWSKDIKYTFDGNTLLTLTADYYEYECIDASYTSVIERDDGGEFYQIDVKAEFTKVTKEKSSLLNDLSNMILFAILKTKNEELIYLGLENGLNPKINETTGGAKTDFNGYSLDLSGVQTEIPPLSRNYPNNPNNPFFVDLNGVTVKLKNGFSVGVQGQADGDLTNKTYTAVDDTTIRDLDPNTDDYTSICTTLVTDLEALFEDTTFNQNISNWDVSNVISLNQTFKKAYNFNQNINIWDVSNVTDYAETFRGDVGNYLFNQPLNNWDTSSAVKMGSMFRGANNFNQPLNNWNTSSVTTMIGMFNGATVFNQNLSSWCVELIPIEPTGFATLSALTTANKPNFGDPC